MPLNNNPKSQNNAELANFAYRANERGATLIVVLFMLILVALAGAIAVKQSSSDLKTATADQINTLLLQSSDGVNGTLEKTVNGDINDQAYKDLLNGGMLWFFLADKRAGNSEYIYCHNTDPLKYLIKKATVREKNGSGYLYNNGGICDYTKKEDYVNERQTTMVQVNVTTAKSSENDEALKHYVEGKEVGSSNSQKAVLDVYSAAVLPSYSEPKGCMEKTALENTTVNKPGGELLDCLKKANTPTKMLFQNVEVENASTGTMCKKYGKDSKPSCVIAD